MNAGTGELNLLTQTANRLTRELIRKVTRDITRTGAPNQSDGQAPECKDGVCVLSWKPRRPAA